MTTQEINAALAATSDENILWRAVLEICDLQKEEEETAVCAPNLTNEAAQYNRGRLALAKEMKEIFIQARTRAQELARG